jgi:hypothetical protein
MPDAGPKWSSREGSQRFILLLLVRESPQEQDKIIPNDMDKEDEGMRDEVQDF